MGDDNGLQSHDVEIELKNRDLYPAAVNTEGTWTAADRVRGLTDSTVQTCKVSSDAEGSTTSKLQVRNDYSLSNGDSYDSDIALGASTEVQTTAMISGMAVREAALGMTQLGQNLHRAGLLQPK